MNEKGLLGVLVGLALLSCVLTGFAINSANDARDKEITATVDLSAQNSQINALTSQIVSLQNQVSAMPTQSSVEETECADGDYVLNKEEFEEEAIESKALELADESVNSRDFKKAVFYALEDVGSGIESYRDITQIKILDSDVDRNEVTYKVKVYFFIDGDEEETGKARLDEFTVEVNDLDFDEDFVDAEVDEGYLDSISVDTFYED